jgi:hypothetical protein
MAEIINIQSLDPTTFGFQEYSNNDTSLINSNIFDVSFDPSNDHIEYFIFDLNNNILFENNIGHLNYKLLNNQLTLDPETDLKSQGYDEGEYNTLYNILSNKLGSSALNTLYIQEISSDRTEIRLNTTSIPNDELVLKTNEFINKIQNSIGGYLDFYLDFGGNQLIIANNILLDNSNPNDPTVLIKLYEPLPSTFQNKNECWVVEQIAESVAYNISIYQTFDIQDQNIVLKGPNLNLDLQNQINNSTTYTNYTSLSNTTQKQNSGSFYYQLNSLLAEKGISINIDYTDYSQFVNLSSAQTRLENFYYKLSLIEQYQTSASLSDGTTTNYYVSSSNILYQNKINEIITNFDGYEYFLYFGSGSYSWPKTNTTPPYTNAGANSVAGLAFLASQSIIAEDYDSENSNNLINAIPSYILEDSNNNQYKLFVEMLGQMFDSIWVYIKDITNKNNADNRLDYGISKDIVSDVLKDLGIKLYQNNFSSNDLYSSLLGFTNSGSLYNLPNTSNSLPISLGWEYINTYVTASATGSLLPTDDINKEIYKRLYHNLPYLLKSKGTVEGLKTLISIFGIPETILRVNEFGGKDKNPSTWDFWQDEYNYSYKSSGSYYISSSFTLNSTWGASNNTPGAVEFRFKTQTSPPTNYSQSLWYTDKGIQLVLEYTGSGLTSGSYSGSTIDPNYQYGTVKFISGTDSASVYLPFFNGGWWSILLNSSSGNYTLYAKNSIYENGDGNTLGYQASSSLNVSTLWSASTVSYFGTASSTHNTLSGSLQEIRYYTQPISEDSFNAFVMNPSSIEQSTYLAFRAALGNELYTSSISIHPKVTGSWITTSSFTGTSNFYYSSTPKFLSNVENVYYDQPSVGIQNIVSNKIKQTDLILPYTTGSENIPINTILSPYISVQQTYPISSSYTNNIDYVEIAFSPQNEINEDIMSSLGYFNIGDYIGDPRQISQSSNSYPQLDTLRNSYFEKYTSNYNWEDYIRLIKYFDNSLFKMIKDFIPAKSSLASGIVIKQHLLERNKYPVPQMNYTQSEYTSSISMYEITGENGGSIIIDSDVTQSWIATYSSRSGSVYVTQSSQDEFYNGEFSGSLIDIKLNETGYKPFINNDYSVSVLPDPSVSVSFVSGSKYPIPFEIDYNKVYYLTFSYGNLNVNKFLSIIDNKGNTFWTSIISPPSGGSAIVEIKNADYPLSFLTDNDFSTSYITATNVNITEYQLTNPFLDPLINNVLDNRLNSTYMDVDYSSNAILAVNSASILTGTATKFAIPDSNYTSLRSINPRYLGSKTTSPEFNKPIYNKPSTAFINNAYSITPPPTQSQVPNASKYSNWFIYFDYLNSSYPEVPNGGNVHAVYAINTEGQAISLKGDNKYINEISNIFSSGTLATIIPTVYSAGNKNPQVTIFDGGAKYTTICTLSGSTYIPGAWGQVSVGGNINSTYLTTGSNKGQLYDNVDTTNETVPLQEAYNEWMRDGVLQSNQTPFTYIPFGDFGIYDKKTESIIFNKNINNNNSVEGIYTYFPLQYGDLIRFGDARSASSTSGSLASGSLDYSFTSLGLYNIVSSLREPTPANPSTLFIYPAITSSISSSILGGPNKGNPTSNTVFVNQNWRIFRRVPDETNITIATLPTYTDPGLLVPENFNPNYDPYELAKKAGVI